jgi:hypothetical protein
MNLKNQVKKYFKLFSSKNLEGLKDILDEKILLIDWNVKLFGFKNVLNFNYKIFKKFKKINVNVEETFTNSNNRSIACKIVISLDRVKIRVIDIIYFNKKKKITKIEAYKL